MSLKMSYKMSYKMSLKMSHKKTDIEKVNYILRTKVDKMN